MSDQTIRTITANNVVENGALIVVCGKPKTGKTCIVENAIFYSLDSFLATKFPPLYFGTSAEFGARYFGKLFGEYLSHSNTEANFNKRKASLWQIGYRQECEDADFKYQGDEFIDSQLSTIVPRPRRPRLLFYFDKCERKEDIDYVQECLVDTPDHRKQRMISIVETTMMFYLGTLSPQILIFTSKLDPKLHVPYLRKVLKCSLAIANDLIETANTFIDHCRVALLINLHQWNATEQRRGLFIYEYSLVPPLHEQLSTKKRTTGQGSVAASIESSADNLVNPQEPQPLHHRHHRRRHHHRQNHSKQLASTNDTVLDQGFR